MNGDTDSVPTVSGGGTFPARTSSRPPAESIARKPLPSQDFGSQPDTSLPQTNAWSTSRPSSDRTPPTPSRLSLTASSGHSTPNRTSEPILLHNPHHSLPPTQTLPVRQRHIRDPSDPIPQPQIAELSSTSTIRQVQPHEAVKSPEQNDQTALLYQERAYVESHKPVFAEDAGARLEPPPSIGKLHHNRSLPELRVADVDVSRPVSSLTTGSDLEPSIFTGEHNRHLSVGGLPSPHGSPLQYARGLASNRYSPDNRPQSYIELLQLPYAQQVAPAPAMDNSFLRQAVGGNASLLDTRKTLEMYRANVKKTNEPAIQYEFAIFMVQAAMESSGTDQQAMLREAKQILQRLADRSYPFAQYYLADGYASGVFNKGKEDYDRAFPLFVAASKHGHAEAGYRAALCYEFGWGCRRDFAKVFQFYRTSASKNHPGAATRLGMACIQGTLGLQGKQRQGISWLKRAAESADMQYNSAPYELARLHETGFGELIFKDEAYAAQLYTQSAELGHAEANLVLGKAYEHGTLMCPKDAALSIHFYTGAAQGGLPEAMMALCAWYLFGAEPILEKNENEAFEWAKQAAELGYAKAEYAVGYFKEVGIGTRQDSLEANVWYVRAAQQGEERATARLAIIRNAAAGGNSKASPMDGSLKGKKGLLSKLGL